MSLQKVFPYPLLQTRKLRHREIDIFKVTQKVCELEFKARPV